MQDHGFPVLRRLVEGLPGALRGTHAQHGDATAEVHASRIGEVLRFLRDDGELDFSMLTDLCAVDHLGEEERFEVVYHLYSVSKEHRVRIKARLPESDPQIESVVALWPSANWMEREVYDLYGLHFSGHPDLRRILLYDGFEGHPLRKDYPKTRRQPLVGPRD